MSRRAGPIRFSEMIASFTAPIGTMLLVASALLFVAGVVYFFIAWWRGISLVWWTMAASFGGFGLGALLRAPHRRVGCFTAMACSWVSAALFALYYLLVHPDEIYLSIAAGAGLIGIFAAALGLIHHGERRSERPGPPSGNA